MISTGTANVGDRIECCGDFGTIKYIGLIEGYSGTWFGIDWDEESRGKHNGSAKGVRYFTARGESSASFVRPEKVQVGQTAVKAVTSRYGQKDDEASAKLLHQQLLSIQQTINAPFVELVGFEQVAHKQSNFKSLEVVNLRLQNVNGVGLPNELGQLCPNVREIDLSKNLLSTWMPIFEICGQLKHLEWLNVSQNLLELPKNFKEFSFPNLKILICGSMRLTWTDILNLSCIFPNLNELRITSNRISNIDAPENCFRSLNLLDLEGNDLHDWSEICKLSAIPTLEHLNLENTGIKTIRLNHDMFKTVTKLVLSGNSIEDWRSISELNKLESLEDLRFLKNPVLLNETYATCVQQIIARIKNLKVLNGSFIKPDERRGAEYDYIKRYCKRWFEVKNNESKRRAFLEEHERFEELLEIYGTPEESELVVQTNVIKSNLIEITFVHEGKETKKRLPPSMIVQKALVLAQRLFDLPDRPTLSYISGAQSHIQIELDDELKELGYYSIQSGDKVIVNL